MKKLPNFKQVSKHSSNTVQEDIKNTPSTRKTCTKSNGGIGNVMLNENDVVDHLIQSLEVNGYSIKQALYDRQKGIDVIADKQGATLYIEVKGETSGDKTSSRYGKPFHSGQVFDMVSKVIFKALDNTNISEFNEKKDQTCIALPSVDVFHEYHAKVSRYLSKLGIVTFWVSENGEVTIEGSLK